jgi:hypothetical protein
MFETRKASQDYALDGRSRPSWSEHFVMNCGMTFCERVLNIEVIIKILKKTFCRLWERCRIERRRRWRKARMRASSSAAASLSQLVTYSADMVPENISFQTYPGLRQYCWNTLVTVHCS